MAVIFLASSLPGKGERLAGVTPGNDIWQAWQVFGM